MTTREMKDMVDRVNRMMEPDPDTEIGRKVLSRRRSNLKILWVLLKASIRYKDMRFNQLLRAFEMEPEKGFNEESVDTLKRVEATYRRLNGLF